MVLGFQLVNYLLSTITNEIIEDLSILKNIIIYHVQETNQSLKRREVKSKLRKKLKKQESYEDWKKIALQFDNIKDIKQWQNKHQSKLYDYKYIKYLRDVLIDARNKQDLSKIIHIIRSHSFRNIANILNPILYKQSCIGTKTLIKQFQEEWETCLKLIAYSEIPLKQKIEFFVETRHAVGRTALILSGGGLLGMYHIGVIKVLYQQNLLPKIIAGASAGSIVASFIATRRYEELDQIWDGKGISFEAFSKKGTKGSILRKLQRFLTTGNLLDITVIREFMRADIGDITFQEAYDKTGFILNISVTAFDKNNQDRILNYLTSPNVCIWSAVCCSCGVPHIYGPSDLYSKNEKGKIEKYMPMGMKFLDGSFSADVPINRLSEFFNVNSFIVSQTNPFMVPLQDFSDSLRHKNTILTKLVLVMEKMKKLAILEVKHRFQQFLQLGLIPQRSQKYLSLFIQNYSGDITIIPVPQITDYLNILSNPQSKEQLQHFIVGGAKRTYNRIPYIEAYTHFERTLEDCYKYLKNDRFRLEDEEEDNLTVELGNQEENEQNFDNIRNFSFIIPRSSSKQILNQVSQFNNQNQYQYFQKQNSHAKDTNNSDNSQSLSKEINLC